MILIIDNYDSFVFNLARYVNQLNFDCVVRRNNTITLTEIEQVSPSHIILSPGPGRPEQAGICLSVVKQLGAKIPILGVCLGHQVIGQACGGAVIPACKPMHGKSSILRHDSQGIFQGLPNPITVGRYHSLVVSSDHLPSVFHVNAYSAEGEIMAMQHKIWPLFSVQFHPESILTDHGRELLQNFLQK